MIATVKHLDVFTNGVNWAILIENGALLVSKMTKAPLLGVATSSKGLFQEESNLPTMRISNGFDPKASKLMEESGYDFSKSPSQGHIIDAKPYGPNEVHKIVTETG